MASSKIAALSTAAVVSMNASYVQASAQELLAGAIAHESARKPFETVVLNGAINLTNQVEHSDEMKRQNWHRHLEGTAWWGDLVDEDMNFEDTQELIHSIQDKLADL